GPVLRIWCDDLGVLPSGLEIVFLHGATMTLGAKCQRTRDAILGVRSGDRDHIAEFIQCDLLLYGIGEFATDLGARKTPLDLNGANVLNDFLFSIDQFRLFVAEIETIAQAETGNAVLSVERRNCDVVAKREFGKEDRRVDI